MTVEGNVFAHASQPNVNLVIPKYFTPHVDGDLESGCRQLFSLSWTVLLYLHASNLKVLLMLTWSNSSFNACLLLLFFSKALVFCLCWIKQLITSSHQQRRIHWPEIVFQQIGDECLICLILNLQWWYTWHRPSGLRGCGKHNLSRCLLEVLSVTPSFKYFAVESLFVGHPEWKGRSTLFLTGGSYNKWTMCIM